MYIDLVFNHFCKCNIGDFHKGSHHHAHVNMQNYSATTGRSSLPLTHIYVGKLTIIGSDNGLSPRRRQTIIWTNAGILLIGPLGTNFCGILIAIEISSFKKINLKISSTKWRPFCLGLNVLSMAWHYHRESTMEWVLCSLWITQSLESNITLRRVLCFWQTQQLGEINYHVGDCEPHRQ